MKNNFVKKLKLSFLTLTVTCTGLVFVPQQGSTWIGSALRSVYRRLVPEGASATRLAQIKNSVVEPAIVRSMDHIPTLRGGSTRMLRNPELFDDITSRAYANQYTNIHWPTLSGPFRRLREVLNASDNKFTLITGQKGVGKGTLVEIFANSTVMNIDDVRRMGNEFVLPDGLRDTLVLRFDVDHYLSSAVPKEQKELFLDGLIENLRAAKEAGHNIIVDIPDFDKLKPPAGSSNRETHPGTIFLNALERMTDQAQVIGRSETDSVLEEIELQRLGTHHVDVPVPSLDETILPIMQHIERLTTKYGVDIPKSLGEDIARLVKNGYTPNGASRAIYPPGAGIRLLEDAVNKLQTKRAAGRPQALLDIEDKIAGLREKANRLNHQLARRTEDFDGSVSRLDIENFDEAALPEDMPYLRQRRLQMQDEFARLETQRAQIEEQLENLAAAESELLQRTEAMEQIDEALRLAGDNIDEQAEVFADIDNMIRAGSNGEFDIAKIAEHYTSMYRNEIEQMTSQLERARQDGNTRFMRAMQSRIEKTQALIDDVNQMNPAEIFRLSLDTARTAHLADMRSLGALNEIDFDLLVETAAEAQFGIADQVTMGRIRAQLRGDMRVFERISEDLSNWIVGQAPILRDISKILRVKMTDTGRGLKGIFFLFGESRLGKTEIGRALQKIVGGNQMMLVEGGQHADAHSRAALIGAPPGYVGYKEGGGGRMTRFAQTSPNGVLMLDEIEKMDSEILDILLTVLETGVWRDMASGAEYPVNWTVIVSANLLRDVADVHPELAQQIARLQEAGRMKESGSIINDTLLAADSGLAGVRNSRTGQRVLRPELLNRADGIYLVQEFINPEMSELVRRMFNGKHIKDYAEQLIGVTVKSEIYELLGGAAARAGNGEVMRSARNVPHKISEFLKRPIDEMRSAGHLQEGDIINVRLKNADEIPEGGIKLYLNPNYLTGNAANVTNSPIIKRAEDGRLYIDFDLEATIRLAVDVDGEQVMQDVRVWDYLFQSDILDFYNWHVAAENIGDLFHYDVLDPNISNNALRALSESDEMANLADEAAAAGEIDEAIDAVEHAGDAAGLTVDDAAGAN